MLRYTLKYKDESIVLTGRDAPVNSDDFSMSLSRSKIFGSVLRSYTVSDKFHGKGKTWINSILKKYGWNIDIIVNVEYYNQKTFKYEYIIENGKLGISKPKQTKLYTEVNIEDGSLQSKVMNRSDVDVNYFNLTTLDGGDIIELSDSTTDIILRGLTGNTLVKAIPPKKLFERLVNSLSGLDNRFDCSLFETYPTDAELSLIMFANGTQIRGYTPENFTISLTNAFQALSANKCLGAGFEDIDGKTKVIFEKRRYFFNPIVVCTLENISDLEYSWADEFMFKELVVGYENFNKKENEYGQSECNNKASYSTPLQNFKETKEIISKVRGDGTTIEKVRELGISYNKSEFDDDNFLIDCVRDENQNVVSRQLEGLSGNPSGIYSELELYTNILLSPARMIYNWGEFLITGLRFDKEKYLKIQKTETFSKLSTTKTGESNPVQDGEDILIESIGTPFLTGRLVKFNATFNIEKILLIKNSPNGLIKFFDIIDNKFNFAYINELQIKLVDKQHQFEGLEAIFTEADENVPLLLDEENGLPALLENGTYIRLEKNMAASSKISNLANLASIPDDAMFLIAYNGSNYNQTGAQLKAALAYDIDGAQSAILQPDDSSDIILGSFATKTRIITYQLTRGGKVRSGVLTVVAGADNSPAVVDEGGLTIYPNTFGETAGVVSITANVLSEQVILTIETDASDANYSELTYMITEI